MVGTINTWLDWIVRVVHYRHFFGRPWHPYLGMMDMGIVAILILAYSFARLFDGLNFAKFVIVLIFVYLSYEYFFLKLKRLIFRIEARSFLQDSVCWLLPAYLSGCWVIGIAIQPALDLVGLILPLLLGFVRVGCFLGGCCYGLPSGIGVCYPAEIFQRFHNCRTFTPGPNPGRRVFPIQLIEALAHFNLFWLLLARLLITNDLSGYTLPFYLLGYSSYRFGSDFFRRSSARPRYGSFSEAQLVSVVLILGLTGWLNF